MNKAMNKYCIKTGIAVILAAAVLIIIMAATTVQTYAGEFNDVSIDENTKTTIKWNGSYDSEAVTHIKIKPSKTGTITFTADFMCYVTLCDANKKVLSKGYYSSGDYIDPDNTNSFMNKVHYGVKKDKTYFLKVYLMPKAQDAEGHYVGVVKYTNSKVAASKCGSSKKKAKAIKKNKTVKGLFAGGNKKAQWFKITNKQKKTKIYIKANKINYALNFKVYYKSLGKWYDATYMLTWQTDYSKDTITGTLNRKAKHTYYIKVTPEGKSSGYYTIKWK